MQLQGLSAADLLRFWRDIEFFNPFDLEEVIESSDLVTMVPLDLDLSSNQQLQQSFTWAISSSDHGRDPEYIYAHDFYFAPFLKSEVRSKICEWFGPDVLESIPEYREAHGLSCIGRVVINDKGKVLLGNIKLSTLAWALDRLLNEQSLSLEMFDEYVRTLVSDLQESADYFSKAEGKELIVDEKSVIGLVPHTLLKILSERVITDSQLGYFPNNLLGVIVSHQIKKRKFKPDGSEEAEENDILEYDLELLLRKRRRVDILNSFCLSDLERAFNTSAVHASGSALYLYLRGLSSADKSKRVNVLDEGSREHVLGAIHPNKSTRAKWPAHPEQTLSLTQQFAISQYIDPDTARLHAVNGPPGTGKTTIVRDIVADLIVARATRLVEFAEPSRALSERPTQYPFGKQTVSFRLLNEKLRGFEIVVASNNNAAVENISRVLPRSESIDAIYGTPRYLLPMAQKYFWTLKNRRKRVPEPFEYDPLIWGLPSVALGNKNNRDAVRVSLFVDPTKGDDTKRKVLPECLDFFSWRKTAPESAKSYQEARRAFRIALKKSQENIAHQEHCFLADRRDDIEWLSRDNQLSAPGQSALSNLLKGQLFLAALELQEAWIREMPYFERELEALAKLLLAPHLLSVTAAQRLWELFFMVIPVVSTTLASVERMFTGLGAEALGHVIIDEAGQATPQSAVGIILRAKRALIIGDQRQLEPICQVPQPIIARVSSILGEHAEEMTALQPTLSAQTFADSANCYGTYLGAGDGADGSFVNLEQGTWVGTPLIVHRRCNEPMFSISNQVAYGGLMIHATKDTEAQLPLGKSCWIQSAGSAEEKQWVPEHGEICIRMVLRLLAFESDNPNFFIITPFRIVKRKLQHELSACLKARGYEPRIIRAVKNVTGTIHTFQGKESDVVILVLGCDFTKGGAAHWAGDRPNLINVAVTRARKALYVVGDANLWHNRGYFSDLEKALPKRSVEEFLR